MDLRLHVLLLLFPLQQQTELAADGKYFHILKTCQFIEKGSQYEVQYYIKYQYNGRLQALYNSSTETVVGFTEYGRQFADTVNEDPHYLEVRRHDLNYFCKILTALVYKDIQGKAVPPVTRLTSVRSGYSGDAAVLVCSAYSFYPRHIRLTWLRDGVVVPDPAGAVITEMPGGAWRYQIHSQLEVTLNTAPNISCMVEHTGLRQPQLLHLGQTELQSRPLGFAVGGSVLGVGLSFLLFAVACYWKRLTEQKLAENNARTSPELVSSLTSPDGCVAAMPEVQQRHRGQF